MSILVVFIDKIISKKTGALICFINFLSSEIIFYLYKSTILLLCLDWCTWSLLGDVKLQKQVWRTSNPTFAACLELLAHCQIVASIGLFYRHYFGRCSTEMVELVPLSYSHRMSTLYSNRLHGFSFIITRLLKGVYINSFFPHNS